MNILHVYDTVPAKEVGIRTFVDHNDEEIAHVIRDGGTVKMSNGDQHFFVCSNNLVVIRGLRFERILAHTQIDAATAALLSTRYTSNEPDRNQVQTDGAMPLPSDDRGGRPWGEGM